MGTFLELKNLGAILAIWSRKIQKLVYDQAIKEQNWLDEGKIKLLGVNLYPALEAKTAPEELYTDLYKACPVSRTLWSLAIFFVLKYNNS
jgi:methylmalonyl-CoA mutase N-terminal domain/subunit